ncbi:protein phosphatase 1 regulatory subunit 14C [Amazona aestiva]|uniref:Protein phosphatase 1 regulatory subunit 14C n=1 Tax=Amazona aestiva TaxID=12930 RepID=A0A0Q3PGD4_AMAAE|nr:protein phosphatase 1 regulatory subunit 14C [Amazona aestiva]
MSVATGGSEAAAAAAAAAAAGGGGSGNRVFFQSPRGGGGSGGSSGGSSREDSVSAVVQVQQRRHQQGKVTVKYDRKELRKRLVLEEWIVEQLGQLYGCEVCGYMSPCLNSAGLLLAAGIWAVEDANLINEEEMPDVEIDIDDLLDAANEEERALKLQALMVLRPHLRGCDDGVVQRGYRDAAVPVLANTKQLLASFSRICALLVPLFAFDQLQAVCSGGKRSTGIYQRTANSDKRNEETQSPSKEEYINNSK